MLSAAKHLVSPGGDVADVNASLPLSMTREGVFLMAYQNVAFFTARLCRSSQSFARLLIDLLQMQTGSARFAI